MLCVSLLLVLGLAVVGTAAYGQQGANITGTVTDPSGAVVPNAKITVTNLDTGFVTTTTTNATGSYRFADLVNGRYTLQVEQQGFKTYDKKDIALDVNATVRIDVALQIGSVGTTVTVEENALQVQADTNDVSQTVTDTQIANLATNGRNILQLVPLVPGASSQMPDFDRPGAQFQSHTVEFNGMRADNNDWIIDGGEAYDRGGGGILLVSPSQDAISEFTVSTSNYAADLGDASGGMTQMAIKSGTKQIHASAWEYDRNDALDADDYFQKDTSGTIAKKAELRYNAFGFNGGGPVEFKSSNPKTFFFYNQEWRREINPGATFNNEVFNQTELNGTEDALNGLIGGHTAGICQTYNPANGNVCQLMWAPETGDKTEQAKLANVGLTQQQPIPNNDLSKYSSIFDANAVAYLKSGLVLQPNQSDGIHYFDQANETEYWREEIGRVDHQFNEKYSIFSSAIWDSDSQAQPNPAWTGNTFPTITSLETVPSWQGVLHLTMNLKPNLLNEIAYNETGNNITIANSGLWTNPSGWAPPPLFANADTDNKLASVFIGGGQGPVSINLGTGNWPWKNWWRSNQIKDDLSYIKGTHNFKLGFAWLWTSKVQEIFVDTAGNYGFYGGATSCDATFDEGASCPIDTNPKDSTYGKPVNVSGLGIGDFLLGFTGNFNQPALQDAVSIHFHTPDAYFVDDWRVTRRLTLNLGIRWEAVPHAYDAHDRASNFYPNTFNTGNEPTFAGSNTTVLCTSTTQAGCTAKADLAGFQLGSTIPHSNPALANFLFYMNGIGLAGQNGIPKGLTVNHDINIGPRLGFAYDVFGDQKTILRGGGGIFFERNAGNEEYNMGTDLPFIASTSVSNIYLSNPTTSYSNGLSAGAAPETTQGFWALDPNLAISQVYQYSLQVQEQMKNNVVATLGFVGNNSAHLSDTYDENNTGLTNISGRIQTCGTTCGGAPFTQADNYRPYLGWSSIGLVEDEAGSHYDSLQATVRATAFHNLTLGLAYTYGHVWDEQDAQIVFGQGGNESDSYNPKYDYGTSGFDRRQVGIVNFDYNLPILQHATGLSHDVLGGWTISGIVNMESGNPIGSVTQSNWTGLASATVRANQIGRVEYPKSQINNGGVIETSWYSTNEFSQAGFDSNGLGVFGASGKSPIVGPGRENWNLSLYKDFKFTERAGFQFKAESFNTWNHTQFTNPGTGVISGSVGGANNPTAAWLGGDQLSREFQFGVRLYY